MTFSNFAILQYYNTKNPVSYGALEYTFRWTAPDGEYFEKTVTLSWLRDRWIEAKGSIDAGYEDSWVMTGAGLYPASTAWDLLPEQMLTLLLYHRVIGSRGEVIFSYPHLYFSNGLGII